MENETNINPYQSPLAQTKSKRWIWVVVLSAGVIVLTVTALALVVERFQQEGRIGRAGPVEDW